VSNRKRTLGIVIFFTVSIVLFWLPGMYLSLVAWFTKFSGNTTLETTIARSAGFASIFGFILSSVAFAASITSTEDAKNLIPMRLLTMSLACSTPLMLFIALKII
jgi:hypothetical protein